MVEAAAEAALVRGLARHLKRREHTIDSSATRLDTAFRREFSLSRKPKPKYEGDHEHDPSLHLADDGSTRHNQVPLDIVESSASFKHNIPMADLQPPQTIAHPEDNGPEYEKMETMTCGSDSPGGVDGLVPTSTTVITEMCKMTESNSSIEVEGGDEDEVEEDVEDVDNPNGTPQIDITELNADELLALSKSRLDEIPQARNAADEKTEVQDETKGVETLPDEEPVVKDQAYFIELAMKKAKESKTISPQSIKSEDPAYVHKLAERKVAEAEAKAKADEERTGEHNNIIKPALLPAKPTRNENSELWALLNYSKARLEIGATPQVGGKKTGSRGSSIRGDDTLSVSSKLSKSSRRSQSSRLTNAPIAVVGGPGDGNEKSDDGPFPDVTDNGEAASVDGSVSLESATKNYCDANDDDDDESNNSNNINDEDDEDEDEEDSSDEAEDEELPDFLKNNDDEEIDPEEARELYEAAKFKAASILSVTKDNLTDVQMLQAIAIAEDAAKNGDDKFSTKRSLFKLNEAKVEDLKSLLSLSFTQTSTEQDGEAPKEKERYTGGWGIGRGRLIKKLGSVVQDFREKCDEIDAKKEKARVGQPTGKDILNAAMLDLRAQIEEYEKIVTKTGKR